MWKYAKGSAFMNEQISAPDKRPPTPEEMTIRTTRTSNAAIIATRIAITSAMGKVSFIADRITYADEPAKKKIPALGRQ